MIQNELHKLATDESAIAEYYKNLNMLSNEWDLIQIKQHVQ
ncbi:14458_t:CDS:2 [Funneliformis mosseae]|uniref:14458_t:CDS:1 n=1 Tax=Funneliformis mosseae TaxID=27381 RepID=A0A9N9G1D8_FUNMO|nr:14458_t:CDS:2 [Funneliformis mosseae]